MFFTRLALTLHNLGGVSTIKIKNCVFYLFLHSTCTNFAKKGGTKHHNNKYKEMDYNTICALATPTGGAIGIIRISGDNAIGIADRIFQGKGGKLADNKPNTIHFGTIFDSNGKPVDEVLASIFRKPHSYTGEDSVEISCHGSRYVMKRICSLLIENGCRQAEPGEYTKRAFINGKMDLSQAEAVADLIASTNKATHMMAMSQLRGNFSNQLSILREKLLKLTSLMELELDFSDHEDLEFADRTELLELSVEIERHISNLAKSFESGKAIKEGIAVAIAGKTNVGKSTLLNTLVGEEKAIVSDIHGTTRDVIEDTTNIEGITFRLIDTAGIRDTEDTIERIGIDRTFRTIQEAPIILWMLDSIPDDKEVEKIEHMAEGKKLIVVNNKTDKADLTAQLATLFPHATVTGISALNNHNTDCLKDLLFKTADLPSFNENDVIVTSTRHYEALLKAKDSIGTVIEGLKQDIPSDLLSEDLRLCLHHLADITGGEITPSETLSHIFSHFCIGK